MSSFLQEQIDGAIEALKALQDFGYLLFWLVLLMLYVFYVLGKSNEEKADTYAEKVRTGKPLENSEREWMFMRRLTIIIVVIICSVAIIKVVAETIADNERPPHHGISHISGPTYSSSSENGNSTYSGGYSSRSTNSYDTYQNAEEYAEDNVEEYLDSGDYDDYDEAYEAAMDDYEYDHDY